MHRTRYGEANPEQVEDALWEQAARNKWTGWRTGQHLDEAPDQLPEDQREATSSDGLHVALVGHPQRDGVGERAHRDAHRGDDEIAGLHADSFN